MNYFKQITKGQKNQESIFFSKDLMIDSTIKSCRTHVTGKRIVGIALAYAGLVGIRELKQHGKNVGNYVGPMSIMTLRQCHLLTLAQQNCQQNVNSGPTNDCDLG